jgi:ribosomal protein S27AE
VVAVTGRPALCVLERTCFRCDGVFLVASVDRRVYCPACQLAYGFPAPAPIPGHAEAVPLPEVRSA